MNRNGVKGTITVKNQNKFVPTWVTISIDRIFGEFLFANSENTQLSVDLKVTDLPPINENIYTQEYCDKKSVGDTYNPLNPEQNSNGKLV